MKLRLAQPAMLDRRRPARATCRTSATRGDHVAIGALTRHRDVETSRPARSRRCRSCRAATGQVGDPQVRHRGTIGGSIAHADPASDLPAVLLALGGTWSPGLPAASA